MVPFLLIAGGVLFLSAAALSDWEPFDQGWPAAVALVLSVAAFGGGVFLAMKHESDACHKAGGRIVGTGEMYPVTTYIYSGKVMIPITNWYERQECRIP